MDHNNDDLSTGQKKALTNFGRIVGIGFGVAIGVFTARYIIDLVG